MTETVDMTLRIKNQLHQVLQKKDPDAQVQINRNTFGWLRLWVTTALFETKDFTAREYLIDQILAAINLKLSEYPFADYQLWTPLEKDQQQAVPPIQLPLWSEILQAPEPEKPVALAEESKRPLVVTFYSLKGGVGRSTSLAFVANILTTHGHRVVMIDFDLEAPGLSFAHPSDAPEDKTRGVLDYLYERYVIPEENTPKIEDCFRRINVPVRGELYLIPAGAYNENYVHLLADLQVRSLYQGEINPIHQLLKDVKSTLDPDVILIDARTGFTEMGAVALFDQADLGIICFSPTSQSFAGLEWVVKAARKQRQYYGIPDLRFLLTPMPSVTHTQQQEWLGQTADWIMQHWEIPTSMNVDDLYYYVPYNPNIITLSSLFTEVSPAILAPYDPIADTIRASLPEEKSNLTLGGSSGKIAESRAAILNELQFHSAIAQDLDTEEIPKIFQRTGDFPKFLQDRIWLVRGAKGTGKTLLFRLFIEKPEEARNQAKPHEKLDNVSFVSGHGPRTSGNTTSFTSNNLGAYEESIVSDKWKEFWEHYLLLPLAAAHPDWQSFLSDPFLIEVCQQKPLTQTQIAEWLVERISSAHASSKIRDELQTINERLKVQNEKIWVLYDDLDTGFGQKYDRRRKALEALLEWWLEIGPHLSNIAPKILLREDIWTTLNFTNKTYYSSRTVELRWEEDDLWRLILRQIFYHSPTLQELIRQQASINDLQQIENAQPDVLRKGLFPLWGERMGRGNKAFTYNWVKKRISDYNKRPFPRSLILLLQNAVSNEKTNYERNPYDVVLRPRSLTDALKVVSEERVSDVRNEYTEFVEYLDKLNGERSPIDVERLKTIWEVDAAKLKELVKRMTAAGILQEYTARSRPLTPDIVRYSVAELYLSGLKMTRFGQR